MSKSSDLEHSCKASLTSGEPGGFLGQGISSAPRDGVTMVQSEPGREAQASTPNSRGNVTRRARSEVSMDGWTAWGLRPRDEETPQQVLRQQEVWT